MGTMLAVLSKRVIEAKKDPRFKAIFVIGDHEAADHDTVQPKAYFHQLKSKALASAAQGGTIVGILLLSGLAQICMCYINIMANPWGTLPRFFTGSFIVVSIIPALIFHYNQEAKNYCKEKMLNFFSKIIAVR